MFSAQTQSSKTQENGNDGSETHVSKKRKKRKIDSGAKVGGFSGAVGRACRTLDTSSDGSLNTTYAARRMSKGTEGEKESEER
jgi:hypothetical protein